MYKSSDENFEELLRRYEQYESNHQNGYFDVEELEQIADFYLWKGRPKESSKAVDLGLKLHPNSTSLQIKRAKIYATIGNKDKAMQILERSADPNDIETMLVKGEILVSLNRFEEADALFMKIIYSREAEFDNLCLDIAYIYLSAQSFERCLKYLHEGIKFNPDNIDILYELAFCYEQTGQFDKCIATHNKIIDLQPYSGETWFNLGQVYFLLNKFDKAVEAYDYATIINENDSAAWLQKSHALFQMENYKEAIENYKIYSEMTEYKSNVLVYIAECYEKMEDFDNALKTYDEALSFDDMNLEAWTGKAICYLEKEEFQLSINHSLKALEIDPNASEVWVYLAEAYVSLELYTDALIAYESSLALEHNQPDTLVALANVNFELGELEKAKEIYLQVYQAYPDTENIQVFLAIASCKLNQIDEALLFLEEAVKLNNNATEIFFDICPEAYIIFENHLKKK